MATATNYEACINSHYARPNLADAILSGLQQAGKDPRHFSYDDLAPLDQFHSRGKQATVELARLAKLEPGTRVLDIGGGIGGPARTLAAEFGCHVTVLDITQEFCRVGEMLTERTGQREQVTFHCASALDMPFEDASFDVVWTQHSTMNIEDKERLYREAYRVLEPRGRLAAYEIMAGPVQPVYFPVPWSGEPGLSFLLAPTDVRVLLGRVGFEEVSFNDKTQVALEWFRERMASMPSTPPALGLHLLLGTMYKPAFQNLVRNLEEKRVTVVEMVHLKT